MRYVVVYDMVVGACPTPVFKCEICDTFEEAQSRKRDFIKIVNSINNDAVLKCLIKSCNCKIYEELKR